MTVDGDLEDVLTHESYGREIFVLDQERVESVIRDEELTDVVVFEIAFVLAVVEFDDLLSRSNNQSQPGSEVREGEREWVFTCP